MRKIVLLTLSLLLLVTLATAQIPTAGNVFFGYSYYNTNLSPIDRANTNGWQASVEGKFLPWIGIVGDVSSHYGSENFPFFCPPIPSPCTVNAGGEIPAVCRGTDRRRPRPREGRRFGHFFRQRPGRRHRLQTHSGGGVEAPGRLRANPFLQHDAEQSPTGDRHRHSVLETRARLFPGRVAYLSLPGPRPHLL